MILSVVARYLVREVALAWLAVASILVAVLLTNRLVRFLAEAASGELPGDVIFQLLGYKALGHLSLVLPASFFLGIVLAFGRLYRDSEMAALAACGVGPRQLYKALFLLAVPLAGLVGWLALEVGPWASRVGEQVQAEAEQRVDVQGVRAGRFMQPERAQGMFYVERLSEDGRRMEGVFVQSGRGEDTVLIVADSGRRQTDPESGDRYLVLEDGYRYQGIPGTAAWRVIRFQRHGILIEESGPVTARVRRAGQPSSALWGSESLSGQAELQWRLSAPLMVLVLTLLAVPLARSAPRDGRYGRLLAAVLIYAGYSNLLTVGQDWIEDGAVPVAVGLWWLHVVVALAALVLLWRQYGLRRRPRPLEAKP